MAKRNPLSGDIEDQDDPIMVNDYNADGEAVEVPAEPASDALPMFDEPGIDLWPRHQDRRVSEVVIAFGGTGELNGHRADVRENAHRIRENARLTVHVTGELRSGKFAAPGPADPFRATYALMVEEVSFGDDFEDECYRLHERIQAALFALEELHDGTNWSATMADAVKHEIMRVAQILNGVKAEPEGPEDERSALDQSLAEAGVDGR